MHFDRWAGELERRVRQGDPSVEISRVDDETLTFYRSGAGVVVHRVSETSVALNASRSKTPGPKALEERVEHLGVRTYEIGEGSVTEAVRAILGFVAG